MHGIERIAELRALARLAADRAQATLAGHEAERRRIRDEISVLTMPLPGILDAENPITSGRVSARWNDWRQHRRRQLADALAASSDLCGQARTKAARLEAKVRAVDQIAAREAVARRRAKRNRALRQGLPEP